MRWFRTIFGKNLREFEIDDAKAAVGLAVGDVARIGIVVANAVLLDFGEEFLHALVIDAIDARAATGGDEAKLVAIGLEHLGDEIAAALFEVTQDADFVIEAFLGFGAVIDLYHPAIEGQVHCGTKRVFNFQHVAAISRKALHLKRKVARWK